MSRRNFRPTAVAVSVEEQTEKAAEVHFAEWESHVFGYGYGTGEKHTLGALKTFLASVGDERPGMGHAYDYQELEKAAGATVAWLLINTLSRANIIEYGTSPRYGWLTKEGEALRDFVASKSVDDLYECCMIDDLDYCSPTFCNCGPKGYSEKKLCFNPFWENRT